MNSTCVGTVGAGRAAHFQTGESHFNGFDRRRLGRAAIDEKPDGFVRDPGSFGQGSHREIGRSDSSPKLSGRGCDGRHAPDATAELNPQSSAERMPRVLRSALWHTQGMASFRKNLDDMVAERTVRSLARVTGVDEKTIRNWRKKGDPSGNLKARQFLEALSLPWPQALGDFELTPEWWAGFHAKFDDTPVDRAIAHIKAIDWDAMNPVQQQAIRSVVVAFEAPPKPTDSVDDAPPKRPLKAG